MSIPVECYKCGRKFQAPKRLTGQQVKCPGCAAPIQVSSSAVAAIGSARSIVVQCQCATQFTVVPDKMGGTEECPTCGLSITVVSPTSPEVEDTANTIDVDGLLRAEMTEPSPPSDPRTPKKKA